MYFRVQRGYAALAIQRKWVGPKAPLWLALFVAVYYSCIRERDPYDDRKDLGGAGNAAGLLLFGKDSSRATYEKEEESRYGASAGSSAGGGGGAEVSAKDTLNKVLGVPGGKVDTALCGRYIFGESKGTGPRTKEWLSWVSKHKIQSSTGLRRGLIPKSLTDRREFRKWLKAQTGLSAEVILRLGMFLEANGAYSKVEKQRYHDGAQRVLSLLNKAIKDRLPIADVQDTIDPVLYQLSTLGAGSRR